MNIQFIPEHLSGKIPSHKELWNECGAAAARAYGGRVINYLKTCADGTALHIEVVNGKIFDAYSTDWSTGKPVITPAGMWVGDWAWGKKIKSYGFEICSRMPLDLWINTQTTDEDRKKFHIN